MLEKRNAKGEEMTRYAFISHMEDYMKKLLTDPQKAEPDEFLKSFGLTGPVCLELLLKKSDNGDSDSSIITRKERIIKGEPDENGKSAKDTFTIKYRIPRKDYTRKMRNAYISLFENYSCDNEMIKENIDKTIPDYSNILKELNANRLSELSNIKKKVSEDCEGSGGATSADASGQYVQPLFSKPIRRKLYITQEQLEYVKNRLMEECPTETDTMFGDFGFDAPGLDVDKNDPAFDHKNIMDKSWAKKKKSQRLTESQGLKSQKLFSIFKKYGKKNKYSSARMDLHNITDDDVIGVFTIHDMPENDEGKAAIAWANSKGYHMNPNDGLTFIELAEHIDGNIIYAVVINRNARFDSYPDGKYNGGFKDYSLKRQKRDRNKA